jgi:hypothetical protein
MSDNATYQDLEGSQKLKHKKSGEIHRKFSCGSEIFEEPNI